MADVREDREGGGIGEGYERVTALSDKLLLLLVPPGLLDRERERE